MSEVVETKISHDGSRAAKSGDKLPFLLHSRIEGKILLLRDFGTWRKTEAAAAVQAVEEQPISADVCMTTKLE